MKQETNTDIITVKECPSCNKRYEETLLLCPTDGTALVTTTSQPSEEISQLLSNLKSQMLKADFASFNQTLDKLAEACRLAKDYPSAIRWTALAALLQSKQVLPQLIELNILAGYKDAALRQLRLLARSGNTSQIAKYFNRFIALQATDPEWVQEITSIANKHSISLFEDIPEIPPEALIPIEETTDSSQDKLTNIKIADETDKPDFSNIKVLILVEDKSLSDLLKELFKELGCALVEPTETNHLQATVIIADLGHPKLDKLRSQAATFVLLASKDEETTVLDAATVWYKPFKTQELVDKAKNLLHKTKLASELKGSLNEVPLAKLLRNISAEELTGELRLFHKLRAGTIFFIDGKVVDAVTEDLSGHRAALSLLIACADKGQFEFSPQRPKRQITINSSLESLLNEAASKAEEETRIIATLPPKEVFLSVATDVLQQTNDHSDELIRISQLFDGSLSLGECLEALHGDLESIKLVADLYKSGALRIVNFGI